MNRAELAARATLARLKKGRGKVRELRRKLDPHPRSQQDAALAEIKLDQAIEIVEEIQERHGWTQR